MAPSIAWQPEAEPLKQLVGYLKDALSAHNQEAQRNASQVSHGVFHFSFLFPDKRILCDLDRNRLI